MLRDVAWKHAGGCRLELLRGVAVHEGDLLLLAGHVLLQHEGDGERRVGEGHLQGIVRGDGRSRRCSGRLVDLTGHPAASPYLGGGGGSGGGVPGARYN